MTLTVTLNLSPEAEATLRQSIAHHDTERVRQMLTDALMPTIEALFQESVSHSEDDQEWNLLADQLITTFGGADSATIPVLSADATTRAGMYEEHP